MAEREAVVRYLGAEGAIFRARMKECADSGNYQRASDALQAAVLCEMLAHKIREGMHVPKAPWVVVDRAGVDHVAPAPTPSGFDIYPQRWTYPGDKHNPTWMSPHEAVGAWAESKGIDVAKIKEGES